MTALVQSTQTSTARLLLNEPGLGIDYGKSIEALDAEWEVERKKAAINCLWKITIKSVEGRVTVIIHRRLSIWTLKIRLRLPGTEL